jgi:hypothetical protein
MHRVTYSGGELVYAVVIVEDEELDQAFDPSDPGPEISAEHLSAEEARAIPSDFVGHLLDEVEAAELDRIMAVVMPKKPPVPSVHRRVEGKVGSRHPPVNVEPSPPQPPPASAPSSSS